VDTLDKIEIGNVLKALRIANGYKIKELSDYLGISRSYISEIETNCKKPSLEIIEKYSKIFKINQSAILMFLENSTSRKYNFQLLLYNVLKKIIGDDELEDDDGQD